MCEHGGGGMPSFVVLPTSALLGEGVQRSAARIMCNSALIESIFILDHLESLELDLLKLLKEGINRSKKRPVTCQSPGRLWRWPHGKLFERSQLPVSWRNSEFGCLFGCLESWVALVPNM